MLRRLGLLALLVLLATAAADPRAAPEPYFTARDLFDLEIATDPQISPDGRFIAYVRRSGDIMTDRFRPSIWIIDVASGRQTPLAAGSGARSQPRWSPSGDRLAYVSSEEGGAAQLFVRWMASGASVRISGLPDAPDSIAWSADGRRIAFSMFVPNEAPRLGPPQQRPEGAQWADPLQVITAFTYRFDGRGYIRPGYNQIFIVSADGGAPRQLSFGPYNHEGRLSWSPDGRTIYFSGNRSEGWERQGRNSEIYALEIASSRITALTTRNGLDDAPAVSPDGRTIAFVGFDDRERGYENSQLYVMSPDGSGSRSLTAGLDRSVASPVWAADGRAIYVSLEDRGTVQVARVGLDGSRRIVAEGLTGGAMDRPYAGGQFSLASGGTLAVTMGSATRPSDIAVVSGGRVRRLTRLNSELLDFRTMASVQRITVASSFDGRPIDAWVTLPPTYQAGRRYPMILEIHGGPFANYGPAFSTDNQLYAAAGYVVVSANPRGSTSYGSEFANLIHHAYPGHDYDDLMSVVDAVIDRGLADPDSLFITGGSGGGILTAWIIGRTNRFRAAAAQKPAVDFASLVLTTDSPGFFSRYWFGRFPWEDHEAFWRRSPLSLVGNVQTPTLVIVGTDDYRTPPSEAEQYYTALQLRNVPTALVRVPGAGHVGLTARPSQSGARANAILAWFERYRPGPLQHPSAEGAQIRTAAAADTTISYTALPGRGTPIVLMHGWASDSSVWDLLAPGLRPAGPLFLVDAPGSGRSPRGDAAFSYSRYAEAAAGVMGREGLDSAVVVAHSFGAYAAREFVRRYSRRACAIVLLDGSFKEAFADAASARAFAGALREQPWPQALESRNAPSEASAATLQRLPAMHRRAQRESSLEWIDALLDDRLYEADPVPVPVLLILRSGSTWATEDHLASLRSIAPGLQVRRIANVSHFLAWDAPDEVATMVREFVGDLSCATRRD